MHKDGWTDVMQLCVNKLPTFSLIKYVVGAGKRECGFLCCVDVIECLSKV